MMTGRAFIFANGEQFNAGAVENMIRPGDFLIAADNGLRYLRQIGRTPDLLIGDLDSIAPAEVDALRAAGVRIEQHPPEKDETDLELAVTAALGQGAVTIRIVAALGGRLDMTLANIFLLALPALAGTDARLEDGDEEVFLVQPGKGGQVEGRPGETVSLLPLGGPASGVRTSGLYYPLRGETLWPERTRGISNHIVNNQAQVSLETGLLICIHSRRNLREA